MVNNWRVGEEVILRGNGKKYEISNFSERDGKLLIGLKGFILWVTEEQIEKVEDLRQAQLRANEETLKKIERYEEERERQKQDKRIENKEAVDYILKNYNGNLEVFHDYLTNTFVYTINSINCVLNEDYREILQREIKKKAMLRENKTSEKRESKQIKPNYYKINVAGTECEVKDVIKATVKDYESVLVANVIKYIMRYRGKNGLEDLKKARTYLDEIIEIMESKNEL